GEDRHPPSIYADRPATLQRSGAQGRGGASITAAPAGSPSLGPIPASQRTATGSRGGPGASRPGGLMLPGAAPGRP
ncbi:MAG TPA: spore coat protein CotH, partial [Dehalococcoidia bacterium]|nr:spore coat protein CotH [Dehalococcoidia bacterium]